MESNVSKYLVYTPGDVADTTLPKRDDEGKILKDDDGKRLKSDQHEVQPLYRNGDETAKATAVAGPALRLAENLKKVGTQQSQALIEGCMAVVDEVNSHIEELRTAFELPENYAVRDKIGSKSPKERTIVRLKAKSA